MQNFVLDASTVLSLFLPGESDKANHIVYDYLFSWSIVHVPYIWHLELRNVLAHKEIRGKIPPWSTVTILWALKTCTIITDNYWVDTGTLAHIEEIIFSHHLTAYDAAYVELALRLGVPLATLDQEVIHVARKLKIDILL
jgi:predicted nucleic acid-binding protein